jgi:hypothetical protein
MAEYLEIGTVPCEEKCPQVGHIDPLIIRKVAEVYRSQLHRWADEQKIDVELRIRGSEHEFGTYYEVHVKLPDNATEQQWNDACKVESDCPTNWDEIAKQELAKVWPEWDNEEV